MPQQTPLRTSDPKRVGRYRVVGRIVGIPADDPIYIGVSPDGAQVAISMLRTDWAHDAAARDRFAAEAAAAKRVPPFCAARVLDAGLEGYQAYLVSEYVPGLSLLEVVAADGIRDGPDLEAVAIGMATGLAAVHQAGLVHGNFGPQYVIMATDGAPRVIEFGITPPYGTATPAGDMLAWAQTVMFAATGRPPTSHANIAALPDPLSDVTARCLDPDPAERPPARSVVINLLGSAELPAGVLAEGMRRASRSEPHAASRHKPRARSRYSAADPDKAQPEPTQPGRAEPGPTQPGRTQPRPTRPRPAHAGPARPGPAHAGPTQQGPPEPGPAQPGPVQPGPVQPGPAHAASAHAGPAHAGPGHARPARAGPAQAGPTHGGPALGGPAHGGPTRAERTLMPAAPQRPPPSVVTLGREGAAPPGLPEHGSPQRGSPQKGILRRGILRQGATKPAIPVTPPRRHTPGRQANRRRLGILAATAVLVLAVAGATMSRVLLGGGSPGRSATNRATTSHRPAASASPSGGRSPHAVIPPAFAGTWSGVVRQPPNDTYPVSVSLQAGSAQGTVRYSGIDFGCSGILSLQRAAGTKLTLGQTITSGTCVNGIVTISATRAGTVWFSFRSAGPVASGRLTRG